jgi:glycosyltransferase involved in cell wall biosynthesis
MNKVAVNGKFLGAPLNGVHRTAARFTGALATELAETGDGLDLYAPDAGANSELGPMPEPRTVGGRLRGQPWENVALPWAARGQLLVNFCNLAPVLHPRFVVMIHDAQTFLHPDDYGGRQATAYRALLPVIGRRAQRVLTVSAFARESLAAHGVAPIEKIAIVHNGADHILDSERADDQFAALGLEHPYFLTLGSVKRYKNMARLFDLFAAPDMAGRRLVVAGGPGADGYGSLAIPPNVRFLGPVNDGLLRALYEDAHAFLFPSQTEGFGLPPAEAMFCGCPVISARAGAMPEVCGDAALYADPEDTRSWIDAVAVLDDGERRREAVARAQARAGRFSWAKAGRRLRLAIADLIR